MFSSAAEIAMSPVFESTKGNSTASNIVSYALEISDRCGGRLACVYGQRLVTV
jgi:hypothetical protein